MVHCEYIINIKNQHTVRINFNQDKILILNCSTTFKVLCYNEKHILFFSRFTYT